MENLENIALEKLKIELVRIIDGFKQDIDSMKRRHAAEGKLKSGETIAVTIDCCKGLFYKFRDACVNNMQGTIESSIIMTDTSVSELKSSISSMFLEIYGITFEVMTNSTTLAGKPNLRDRYMPDIETEKESTLSEVMMFIDSELITKRNKGIKGIFKSVFGWVSKAVGAPSN